MNCNYVFLLEDGNPSFESIIKIVYKGVYRLKEYPVIIKSQYPTKALYRIYGK